MKEYLEVMIEKLSDLIAIKSVKGEPTKEAPYGKETLEALEYVLELGKAYGMTAVNVDGRAGYLEYGEGERMVGVLLHLDVVPEQDGWLTEPYTLTRKDGYLYGRGISDDKGPAIAAFFALVDLINKGEIDGYRVRLIFGLDEEMGSSCMAHYVKSQELPTLGFVPDADFPVIYAEKGILNLDIVGPGSDALTLKAGDRPNVVPGKCYINKDGKDYVFEGKPAHGAAPFDGINAVSVALEEEESFTSDPFLNFFNQHLAHKHYGEGLNIEYKDETGKLTVNPGLVGINRDKSFVTINIRYPATMDFDSLVKNISDIANQNGFTIENVDNNPPLYVEKDSFLVRTLLEVYREKTEDYSKPLAIGGGTYARTMPNLVAFGMNMPGDAQNAHQANESIKEKRLYEAAEIYRESIKRLGQGLIDQ